MFADLVQAVVNYSSLFLSDLLSASADAATDCSQEPRAIRNRIAASDFGRLGPLAGSRTALGVGNASRVHLWMQVEGKLRTVPHSHVLLFSWF